MATLTQLEYIVAVEKYRHFGEAAKACHVSQPTLSMQIQKVEDELSVIIFDRVRKPIVPTSKGYEIIEQAKLILKEHDKLIHLSKSQNKELRGNFRLAVIPTIAPYLVPRFMGAFSKKHKQVNFHIEEMKTSSIIEALKQDQIDVGILATPLHESIIKERPLYYEPFYLYVHKEHPLSRKRVIREEDLDESEMWLLQDGHCFRTQVVKFCSFKNDSNLIRNLRFEGGSFETLRQLIRMNQGYTLVPYLFTDDLSSSEKKISVRAFEAPIPVREVSLVFRADHWRDEYLEALEKIILESIPSPLKSFKKDGQTILEVV